MTEPPSFRAAAALDPPNSASAPVPKRNSTPTASMLPGSRTAAAEHATGGEGRPCRPNRNDASHLQPAGLPPLRRKRGRSEGAHDEPEEAVADAATATASAAAVPEMAADATDAIMGTRGCPQGHNVVPACAAPPAPASQVHHLHPAAGAAAVQQRPLTAPSQAMDASTSSPTTGQQRPQQSQQQPRQDNLLHTPLCKSDSELAAGPSLPGHPAHPNGPVLPARPVKHLRDSARTPAENPHRTDQEEKLGVGSTAAPELAADLLKEIAKLRQQEAAQHAKLRSSQAEVRAVPCRGLLS